MEESDEYKLEFIFKRDEVEAVQPIASEVFENYNAYNDAVLKKFPRHCHGFMCG